MLTALDSSRAGEAATEKPEQMSAGEGGVRQGEESRVQGSEAGDVFAMLKELRVGEAGAASGSTELDGFGAGATGRTT